MQEDSSALPLTYRQIRSGFPHLCTYPQAVYAEEVMDGFLHGSDLLSSEFSVRAEGEGH